MSVKTYPSRASPVVGFFTSAYSVFNGYPQSSLTERFHPLSTTTIKHEEFVRFDDDEFTDGTWLDKP